VHVAVSKKQRIIDEIRSEIESGRLKPGELLPSTPVLRERYGAAIITVRDAISALKVLGLVDFVPGIGVQVLEAKKGPS
jgi:DNA-binding GntR family transcriptional regulator